MYRTFLSTLIFVSLSCFSLSQVVANDLPTAAQLSANAAKTNVLFILADDLGWRDLSNEGSTFYESPHIDRIANEGVKFTRGYATCQVCSPSRASIMTGKYPARLDITDWIGAGMGKQWKRNTKLLPATYNMSLPQADTSIAEAFKAGGYKTFFAGKWHLGGEGSFPEDHGFDVNVGGHHRGSPPGGFFSPYNNPKMSDGEPGEILPVRLGQETAKFIEANKDEPFFAFLSFYSVHAPIQSTEALWKKYRAKALKQGVPESRFIVDRTSPVRQTQDHPLYGGMVESMDDGVGVVLETLDRLGLTENTVIVFTSDNGGVSAGDGKATSNLPLRGGKGRQWEGGIREPFYIKWNEAKNGTKCETLATGTDFYPTLLEICGLPAQPKQHVDGKSLVSCLKGDTESDEAKTLSKRKLFWHYPHYGNQGGDPSTIVRDGDWKLIYYHEDSRTELYNVATDIGEQTDVSVKNLERVESMKNDLDTFLMETEARMPIPNPNFDTGKFEAQRIRTREVTMPNLEKQHLNFLKEDFVPRGGWRGTGKNKDGGKKKAPNAGSGDVSELAPIFNGTSLEGWAAKFPKGGDEEKSWTVADGQIVAENEDKKGSNLWTKKNYRDFALELKYKTPSEYYDTGVFVHSEKHQVQIGISGSLQKDMTACIYAPIDKLGSYPAKSDKIAKVHKVGDWNHLKIVVKGKRIKTFLNDELMVDYDSPKLIEEGPIGLQLHAGHHMKILFKDIKLMQLK